MIIFKKISHYLRGIIYILLYDVRYRKNIPQSAKAKEQLVTIQVDDISYNLQVHVAEGGLAEDLYICSIREYPNVFFFKRFLERRAKTLKTYIDIGANIGYYAFLAGKVLDKTNTHARIYAMEPVKSTLARLKKNITFNNAKHIHLLNAGAGDKDTEADMIVMKQRNLSKIKNGENQAPGDVEKIEKITLYSLPTLFAKNRIPKKDVMMRCDIEGYEYNLIVGNKDFLKKLTNAHIVMEFHPFYLHAQKSIELLNTLKSAGFKLDQVISCEPLYFVMMPKLIRRLLIRLFLFQYHGETLGRMERFRAIDDLIREVRDEQSAMYYYPNLHFYFSKQ